MSTQTEPIKTRAIPPPPAMVEVMISQLEGVFSVIQIPDYVERASKEFVESLRKWSQEGK